MSCPVWAKSMVLNYRRMYKEKYGKETQATDDEIWAICETIHDDANPKNAEIARVEAIDAL